MANRVSGPGPANAPIITLGVQTYDKFSAAAPYKSVYASDDAKLLRGPRNITNEPVLPSLATLQLKGIFKPSSGSALALLSFEGTNYTARDGGLFEGNRTRLKNVSSKVLRDRVILEGQDRIPHEITFKTSL